MPRYNFDIIMEDGVGRVVNVTQDMPDGLWSVGGSYDEFGAGVNVTHRLPNGQFISEAQHFANPENYKDREIPGLKELKNTFISIGYGPADAERFAMDTLRNMQKGNPPQIPLPPPPAIPDRPPVTGFMADERNLPEGSPEPELTSRIWPKAKGVVPRPGMGSEPQDDVPDDTPPGDNFRGGVNM